jgi:diguanylate cyclase (GGDEF)-like protein
VLNTELGHEIEARKGLEMELRVLATTDPLTGLYNRRRFLELGEYEIQREQRNRRGLALMVMDLDHFKRVNDQHGHAAGDEVLRRFAVVCKNNLRAMDSIGRIGGEEFAILLPETNLEEGTVIADKIRSVLAASPMSGQSAISITVSIGVVLAGEREAFAHLLARGDACLYAAKGQGRNRVVAGAA